MRADQVASAEEALAYITDCNLATVSHMALLRSKSKSEFRRQIDIAQKTIWWMQALKIDFSSTRAQYIADTYPNASVKDWVKDLIAGKTLG